MFVAMLPSIVLAIALIRSHFGILQVLGSAWGDEVPNGAEKFVRHGHSGPVPAIMRCQRLICRAI